MRKDARRSISCRRCLPPLIRRLSAESFAGSRNLIRLLNMPAVLSNWKTGSMTVCRWPDGRARGYLWEVWRQRSDARPMAGGRYCHRSRASGVFHNCLHPGPGPHRPAGLGVPPRRRYPAHGGARCRFGADRHDCGGSAPKRVYKPLIQWLKQA